MGEGSSVAFRLGFLVAHIARVEWALREDDLDSRRGPHLVSTLVIVVVSLGRLRRSGAFLDDEERVDLVHVTETVTCDRSQHDGFAHTEVECLDGDFSITFETTHHKGDQSVDR